MESRIELENFLARVRKKRKSVLYARGVYWLLALIVGGALFGALFGYYSPKAREFGLALGILFSLAFLGILYRYFIRGVWAGFTLDQAALLTEEKHPHLDNALINATQLKRHLSAPEADERLSLDMIQEQIQRTQSLIKGIAPQSVVDSQIAAGGRNLFLGLLVSLGLAVGILPDLFQRALDHWNPAGNNRVAQTVQEADGKSSPLPPEVLNYKIVDLQLEYNFPAYSKLKSRADKSASGEVRVLPGTEVKVQARVSHPVSGAELVINGRDHFSSEIFAATHLKAQFLVKEKGFYQFNLKDSQGGKHLLEKKYPIIPVADQSPTVVLFLANPKPVYYDNDKVKMFYEGNDDYGIRQIDLLVYANGKELRNRVKYYKDNETVAKGNYSWDLGKMNLNPGDVVEYFLEIQDNDNVLGPNKGQSESYRFTIFDSREEKENLILLQEELTEKLIAQLGTSLVKGHALTNTPADMMKWRDMLTASADSLIDIIGLAQRIEEQAENLPDFPRPYINLLKNIISGLTRIREEQLDNINKIESTVKKTTPVGYNVSPVQSLNRRLIAHLETDVLFLVRMTNRQKMDRVLDLNHQLNKLTESLREEFEKLRDKKAPLANKELQAKIDQIKQTMQKIMDQLSRQTQTMPDEFLNPEAFKGMNMEDFTASLDKIMDLANEGKIDQALKELEKTADDLQTLSNQLDQARSQMDTMVDMETMNMLEESLQKIDALEKQQKEVLDETMEIGKSLRKKQTENFSSQIDDLFEALKKDVNQIQSILEEDNTFLEQHPTMKQLNRLVDEKSQAERDISAIGQSALDAKGSDKRQNRFMELNEARQKKMQITQEIDALRVLPFREFKNVLPELKEKYDTLEELSEMRDLNEFNRLFKNTYPEVFQWQNQMHSAHNRREEIGGRIDQDLKKVAELNSDISQKLGSMMRTLRDSDDSLLDQASKEQMENMGSQESEMNQQAEELARSFNKMNEKNPMVSPELAAKMSRTGRAMKRAESRLRDHNVQKSINAENRALKELQEAKNLLKDIQDASNEMAKRGEQGSPMKLGTGRSPDPRRGGSVRMQKEKVDLPAEDQYQVPSEFREDILKAMKKTTPKSYRRMVMEYYKELVK
jgi:hypothetical protein